jgi:hypothetical protein
MSTRETLSIEIDPADGKSTPEHALWFAVLETYFIDGAKKTNSDERVKQLLEFIQSKWTITICILVDFDHSFLVEKYKEYLEKHAPAREAYRKRKGRKYSRMYPNGDE